jgi:alpha-tubulin suppressor-like RCC1 family protein
VALTLLASAAGSAVCLLAAEDVGLVRASATSPGPALGSVALGTDHGCAVRTDGTLVCWGDNTFGQSSPPTGTFTQVSAGTFHTCGVKTDGTFVCWGDNFSGQVDMIFKDGF